MTRAQFLFAAALIAGGTAGNAVQADTLTPAQIETEIVGKTMETSRMGRTMTIRYDANGTLAMDTPRGPARGTWEYSETGICATITEGPRPGTNCTTFTALGGGAYETSRGATFRVVR